MSAPQRWRHSLQRVVCAVLLLPHILTCLCVQGRSCKVPARFLQGSVRGPRSACNWSVKFCCCRFCNCICRCRLNEPSSAFTKSAYAAHNIRCMMHGSRVFHTCCTVWSKQSCCFVQAAYELVQGLVPVHAQQLAAQQVYIHGLQPHQLLACCHALLCKSADCVVCSATNASPSLLMHSSSLIHYCGHICLC